MELAKFHAETEHFLRTADLEQDREKPDRALRQLVLREFKHTK